MALVIETGSGTPGANAYCSTAFVTSYLTDRNRETENTWSTRAPAVQEAAVIQATDFIDKKFGRRFKGIRLRETVSGRVASGSAVLASLPLDTETITLGVNVYRFVATLAQENDVLIGATVADSLANLVAAITQVGATESIVQEDTRISFQVTAAVNATSGALEVSALVAGESGNDTAFSTTITGATLDPSGGFLAGGLDRGPQPLQFPRDLLYSYDGRLITGVPAKVKQATAEYAVRSLSAALAPDPTVNDSLVPVTRSRVKAGPIEEDVTFAAGGVPRLTKQYPAADLLLSEFLKPRGGVMR